MDKFLAGLRELNTGTVLLRLMCAVLFGGLIGLEREQKHKQAGFRTYMLVCLGSALTVLLGQYDALMLGTRWASAMTGMQTDVSRFGAQVINGIGFLGAGAVIVTGRQQVKGLTTAAGLWASACMGLAIGAGFYECMILGFVMIFFVFRLLPVLESAVVEKSRNMILYAEFSRIEDVDSIISRIREQDIHIYDVELEHSADPERSGLPCAVFTLLLPNRQPHTQVLAAISSLEHVSRIEEI